MAGKVNVRESEFTVASRLQLQSFMLATTRRGVLGRQTSLGALRYSFVRVHTLLYIAGSHPVYQKRNYLLGSSPSTPGNWAFLQSRNTRRSRAGRIATTYSSTMEHSAAVIICGNNPNVSESGVSHQTNI